MPFRSLVARLASSLRARLLHASVRGCLLSACVAGTLALPPTLAAQPVHGGEGVAAELAESLDEPAHDTIAPEERGRQLYRALRCDACHDTIADTAPLPAPALDQLPGQLHRDWLVDWLLAKAPDPDSPPSTPHRHMPHRRMPYVAVSETEAQQLADYLLAPPGSQVADSAERATAERASPDSAAGRELFVSLGCLACHPESPADDSARHASLDQPFGGGDLARIADKRPQAFFARWLEDPAAFNRDHRMPVFALSIDERAHLAAYLATRRGPRDTDAPNHASHVEAQLDEVSRQAGRAAFLRHRCHACHRGPDDSADHRDATRVQLEATANWSASCAALTPTASPTTVQPGYRLAAADVRALATYRPAASPRGAMTLEERNCLACHARDTEPRLEREVAHLTTHDPAMAPLADALLPPTLKTVGAKLKPAALLDALSATQPPLRPWLRVRMPRYAWRAGERESLADYLREVDQRDEFADGTATFLTSPTRPEAELLLAGSRLVTADGFGCMSCHAIGSVAPARPEPGKRGPNLHLLGQRIRPEWFAAFVRNPARIAPRMEMPSILVGVAGVLDGHLDDQLAALWHGLNQSQFAPPRPNPVRVLRHGDAADHARPLVLNDIVHEAAGTSASRTWIYPLLVGFPNRHNGLYDLEAARLVRWSLGDMAYQRTEGKRWYWEPAGQKAWHSDATTPELSLVLPEETWEPRRDGQFYTRIDDVSHVENGIRFQHRLHFQRPGAPDDDDPDAHHLLLVQQTWRAVDRPGDNDAGGFQRELLVQRVPRRAHLQLALQPHDGRDASPWRVDQAQGTLHDGSHTFLRWHGVSGGSASLSADGVLTLIPDDGAAERTDVPPASGELATLRVVVDYLTQLRTDRFPIAAGPARAKLTGPAGPAGPASQPEAAAFDCVPGFRGQRLPIPMEEMPTALGWLPPRLSSAPDARGGKSPLLFASLKGRVIVATDSDGDGLEETLQAFSDELATPYGLAVRGDAVDVLTKTGLLRLFDDDHDLRADRLRMIADGWGHTDDYHDWAVGLPIDRHGRYYVGLPCQQDDRSAEAAWLRGRILQLTPREPSERDPREYTLREFAAGQRFPMGLALDSHDRLFATDNQGNYNAYNELNHVEPGAHYGFINRRERDSATTAATVHPAAIELPHPWTRSVNGICFLRGHGDQPATFGPWEGQLVGCEYDTRRLVRMSLESVEGVLQGAVYPMSREPDSGEERFLGPICAAVGPDNALYVGGLRDSGWGGANNVGEIVRLACDARSMPTGIAEIHARPAGFVVRFSRPVDAARAADSQHYRITSAYRVSTAAYGGDDQGHRAERIQRVSVSSDRLEALVELEQLDAGRVYAFQLQSLADDDRPFFPAEGYYTLRRVPQQR